MMNYIGSKLSLIPFIKETVYSVVGKDLSDKVFCDLFAGSGIVAKSFNDEVKFVIANDVERYSYCLCKHYLQFCKCDKQYRNVIDKLNECSPMEGFIYRNYCPGGGTGRNYFTDDNGKKIDAIRFRIIQWKHLDPWFKIIGYWSVVASLLEAADKAANTASTYVAYLKHVKRTAKKPITLEVLQTSSKETNVVHCLDAKWLVRYPAIQGDICYYDPPYNGRQYGCYYHLLNTLVDDQPFNPQGVTGQRDYYRSRWCNKRTAPDELDDLLNNSRFKYVFMSYNNEGIIPMDVIRKTMSKYGKYDLASTPHRRFKQDANRVKRPDNTMEYIHILEKR